MSLEDFKEMFALCLSETEFETETRYGGHMGATEYWVNVSFRGKKMNEFRIRREEFVEGS